MIAIETPRFILREYLPADRDAFIRYQTDPAFTIHHTVGECGPALANSVFQLFLDWQIESPRRNVQLAVERRGDGVLVGSCGARMEGCAAGEAEFGIELARVFWGCHGYATEISRAMIGWAFSHLDIRALIAHTAPGNEAVARLASWAGFERTACEQKQVWRLQR